MSEPIPLRDGHSRRRQEGRGEEEKRFGSLEKTSGGRRTVAGACQAEAATEKAGSQLRVLCFRIQFVVIRTGPSFVRYVCSFFLCTSLPPPPRFYLLFRDTRPVVKLIDPLWLRCRVHATTNCRTRHRASDHASFAVRK